MRVVRLTPGNVSGVIQIRDIRDLSPLIDARSRSSVRDCELQLGLELTDGYYGYYERMRVSDFDGAKMGNS